MPFEPKAGSVLGNVLYALAGLMHSQLAILASRTMIGDPSEAWGNGFLWGLTHRIDPVGMIGDLGFWCVISCCIPTGSIVWDEPGL